MQVEAPSSALKPGIKDYGHNLGLKMHFKTPAVTFLFSAHDGADAISVKRKGGVELVEARPRVAAPHRQPGTNAQLSVKPQRSSYDRSADAIRTSSDRLHRRAG